MARPLFLLRKVERPPPLPGGALIVCSNHASYLDPGFMQLIADRRLVFVMTNDFYSNPFGRWFFKLVGAIPVGAGRLARAGMERAIALLREGQSIGIFPEGKLSLDGTLDEGQRGVAILSRMGQAPVLPMAIDGNLEAWPQGQPWFKRSDVRVAFGPLIPPPPSHPGLKRHEQVAFAARVMSEIEKAQARVIQRRSPAQIRRMEQARQARAQLPNSG